MLIQPGTAHRFATPISVLRLRTYGSNPVENIPVPKRGPLMLMPFDAK